MIPVIPAGVPAFGGEQESRGAAATGTVDFDLEISHVLGRDRVSTAELMQLDTIESGAEWSQVVARAEKSPKVSLHGGARSTAAAAARTATGVDGHSTDDDADFHDVGDYVQQ